MDDFTPDSYDTYIGAQLLIPRGSKRVAARVTKRVRDEQGRPIGVKHPNPILDTRRYTVEFSDGTTEEYYANSIAENLFSQIDSEGRSYAILKEIIDYKSDGNAITKLDGYFTTRSGARRPKQTTRGWKLCVEWRDGTSDWIPLKDLKASNHIEVAEYAIANGIAEEPAFKWWVPFVIKKRKHIIAKVKARL